MAKVHTITLTKDGEQVSYSKDLASVVQTLRNGQYTITIARRKDPRSIDQNSLMWLWFTCIEAETGTPREDVHDYYCKMFLRKYIEWNGHSEIVVCGTSKLSKNEMTNFLEKVQADALGEFGIRLPLPEDKAYEDFYNTYK